MLDKIKEALGEELSKSVEEAIKKAGLELAIMNDGSVVKADKHDTLKSEYKDLETKYTNDITESNNKLEEAMKGAADYDTLKGTLENLKAENNKLTEEFEQEKLNIKKNSIVEKALLKSNVKEQYIDMVKGQLDMKSFEYTDDGLKGLDDAITNLQNNFGDLFGEIKRKGLPPKGNDTPPQIGKKAQLIDQYNKAEKSGDTRAMFALTKQIKQCNE